MLEGHFDLKVKNFCQGTNISTGDKERWKKEIKENHILIFIGQKFLNLLEHGTIDLTQVNLLIMDECHHASGDDDYARILKGHYHRCSIPPRILGLTASISAQKIEPSKLPKIARELENLYRFVFLDDKICLFFLQIFVVSERQSIREQIKRSS